MPELNSINLFEYIKNGLFLKNLDSEKVYDAAVFDRFDNDELKLEKIQLHKLEKLDYDFSLSGVLASFISNYENLVLILNEFNVIYLLPILESGNYKNLTIINLGTGITSYLNKHYLEDKDIGLLSNFGLNIYEPYDMASFFEIIKKQGPKYIRISNKEMPINIFGEDNRDLSKGIISLTDYELSGTHGTLLCPGYMLEESIGAVQSGGGFFDLFCFFDYNFQITEELRASILKTEKIVVLLDQIRSNLYEKLLKAKLWESGLFDTEISFVYPSRDKLNTTLKDYIFEQTEFNAENIHKKL